MATKKVNLKPKYMCYGHHPNTNMLSEDNFYTSNITGTRYKIGYLPLCKICLRSIFEDFINKTNFNYRLSIYHICHLIDFEYRDSAFKSLFQKWDKKNTDALLGGYLRIAHATHGKFGVFADSVIPYDLFNEWTVDEDSIHNYQLTEEDKNVREEVIRLIGNDPLEGYSYSDKHMSMLYNDILNGINANEDYLDDSYKFGVFLTIMQSNFHIRLLDTQLSAVTSSFDIMKQSAPEIKALIAQKNNAIDALIKLYDKNKWLSENSSQAKSTLSYIMKNMRELDFEKGMPSYFRQFTGQACKDLMDLSHKSIIDNIDFGDVETNAVFKTQRELILQKDEEIENLRNELQKYAKENYELKGGVVQNVYKATSERDDSEEA